MIVTYPDSFGISFDALPTGSKANLWTLYVGTTPFEMTSATQPNPSAQISSFGWADSIPSLSDGDSVTVRLTAPPLSTDATLSGLALASGTTPVSLNETFAPGTYSYTADVASSVHSVTVTPSVNHTEADYELLDGSDNVITGDRVNLSVGDNTIKVKVTAEDGTSFRTYTVTVTQAARPPTACGTVPAGETELWCATLRVGNDFTNYGYSASLGFGSVSPDFFDHDGTRNTVRVLAYTQGFSLGFTLDCRQRSAPMASPWTSAAAPPGAPRRCSRKAPPARSRPGPRCGCAADRRTSLRACSALQHLRTRLRLAASRASSSRCSVAGKGALHLGEQDVHAQDGPS